MWTVIQNKRGKYYVKNRDTGELRGTHDCLRWAEVHCTILNEREQHEQRHSSKDTGTGEAVVIA